MSICTVELMMASTTRTGVNAFCCSAVASASEKEDVPEGVQVSGDVLEEHTQRVLRKSPPLSELKIKVRRTAAFLNSCDPRESEH